MLSFGKVGNIPSPLFEKKRNFGSFRGSLKGEAIFSRSDLIFFISAPFDISLIIIDPMVTVQGEGIINKKMTQVIYNVSKKNTPITFFENILPMALNFFGWEWTFEHVTFDTANADGCHLHCVSGSRKVFGKKLFAANS
jgi:hypothetical protein